MAQTTVMSNLPFDSAQIVPNGKSCNEWEISLIYATAHLSPAVPSCCWPFQRLRWRRKTDRQPCPMQRFPRSWLKARIINNDQIAKVTNRHLNFTQVIKSGHKESHLTLRGGNRSKRKETLNSSRPINGSLCCHCWGYVKFMSIACLDAVIKMKLLSTCKFLGCITHKNTMNHK